MEHDEYALKMDSKLFENVMFVIFITWVHTVVHKRQNSIVQIAFLNFCSHLFCAFVEPPTLKDSI